MNIAVSELGFLLSLSMVIKTIISYILGIQMSRKRVTSYQLFLIGLMLNAFYSFLLGLLDFIEKQDSFVNLVTFIMIIQGIMNSLNEISVYTIIGSFE